MNVCLRQDVKGADMTGPLENTEGWYEAIGRGIVELWKRNGAWSVELDNGVVTVMSLRRDGDFVPVGQADDPYTALRVAAVKGRIP